MVEGDEAWEDRLSMSSIAREVVFLSRDAIPYLRKMHGDIIGFCDIGTDSNGVHFREHACVAHVHIHNGVGRLFAVLYKIRIEQYLAAADRARLRLRRLFHHSSYG